MGRSGLGRLALAAALLLSLGACTGPEQRGDAPVEIRLDAEPAAVGAALLAVTVVDESWRPLNGAHVRLTPVPPGRDPLEPVNAAGVGAGRYHLEAFPLDVVGAWSFTVRVELAGGRWAETDLSLDVSEAPSG